MNETKRGVVEELHKPARKHFERRKVVCKGFDDLWQTDLADLQAYSRENAGYRYILIVIDCFSKYMWTAPIKNKTGEQVARAFENILRKAEGRKPKNLQSDHGTEFYNSKFRKVTREYDINHFSTFSVLKACMAERVIRTLKTWMFKEFNVRGNRKWTDLLPQLTEKYNRRVHRSIGMQPTNVTANTKLNIIDSRKLNKQKFQNRDIVRISKFKGAFEKGYLPSWSTELFRVVRVLPTKPITYLIDDMENNPVRGCFYTEELQKTNYPSVYLINKIIRKKKDRMLVNWLGFDNSHNSWINEKDLVKR